MKTNFFERDLLSISGSADSKILLAGPVNAVSIDGTDVLLTFNYCPIFARGMTLSQDAAPENGTLRLRAYNNFITRMTLDTFSDSEMLEFSGDLTVLPLNFEKLGSTWTIRDSLGEIRAKICLDKMPLDIWNNDPANSSIERFSLEILTGSNSNVKFCSYDQFFYGVQDSLVLAKIIEQEKVQSVTFALECEPDEHFTGTGERFNAFDLHGQTIKLSNVDALGCNSRRAYKNIPFFISSRHYGVFIHSSAEIRLSLAGESTRSVSAVIDDEHLDIFIIGGATPERILYHYRRITGFPPELPLWTYGVWMSRMSYFSAEEVKNIGQRLRDEKFPCDVLHLDTGYFAKDWICEWKFGDRFPDPAGFMREMLANGYRITLWQTPNVTGKSCRYDEGIARQAFASDNTTTAATATGSDFSGEKQNKSIDFSSENGREWYRELIGGLLETGAAAIKTDFGEEITPGDYTLPAALLHNRYALLYQKCAFEHTQAITGEGVIWARSAWAGSQRYPIHWGGDAECSFAALTSSLCGALHFGLSGFAHWSCDVPGFHGREDFMHNRPSDILYLRWTQMAIFLSHIRYHGTSPREPYEYPAIAGLVKQYWQLRYALIPYLTQCAAECAVSGFPVVRAMLLEYPDDPFVWQISDQFFCGHELLIAPVLNETGVRDIYLPEGEWVDFWNGKRISGGRLLRQCRFDTDKIGIYARAGSEIPIYPELVQHTGEMDLSKVTPLKFDHNYRGAADTFSFL